MEGAVSAEEKEFMKEFDDTYNEPNSIDNERVSPELHEAVENGGKGCKDIVNNGDNGNMMHLVA